MSDALCQICFQPLSPSGICMNLVCPGPPPPAPPVPLTLPDRLSAGAASVVLVAAIEVMGMALAPFTLGLSGAAASLGNLLYLARKDLPDGYNLGDSFGRTTVVNRAGEDASRTARVARNLPYALPFLLAAAPDPLGAFGLVLAAFVLFVDAAILVATGRTIGDFLAGTRVVTD